MKLQTDVSIVGAGIVGLAHAYHAARKGLTVTVFERSAEAQGASTRNFGMLALVAQPEGRQSESALRALTHWQRVAACADISLQQSGCLFLANEQEELQVLEEFVQNQKQKKGHAPAARSNEAMLSKKEVSRVIDLPVSDKLLGGAWSDAAWKLDQRTVLAKLSTWLRQEFGVTFCFDTEVKEISSLGHSKVEVQAERTKNTAVASIVYRCSHAIVCGGNEFQTLYPDIFAQHGVTSCELQMLRTVAQPASWKLRPFVLGGLSITRYRSFESCASLPELIKLQQSKYGAYLQHGIHLIVCQEADGSITIGDSHQYGKAAVSNRSKKIDDLMLAGVGDLISLPDMQIAERWLGHYAHLPDDDILVASPASGVTLITVTNGQGMTHAFALAEDTIEEITA